MGTHEDREEEPRNRTAKSTFRERLQKASSSFPRARYEAQMHFMLVTNRALFAVVASLTIVWLGFGLLNVDPVATDLFWGAMARPKGLDTILLGVIVVSLVPPLVIASYWLRWYMRTVEYTAILRRVALTSFLAGITLELVVLLTTYALLAMIF